MITKTYPIITIEITQIIDSTLNQNLSFSILQQIYQVGPNGLKWIELTEYTELNRCGQNRLEQTKLNQNGPNWTEVNEVDRMNRN